MPTWTYLGGGLGVLTCTTAKGVGWELKWVGLISGSGHDMQLPLLSSYHCLGHCCKHFLLSNRPNNPIKFYEDPHFSLKKKSAGFPWHFLWHVFHPTGTEHIDFSVALFLAALLEDWAS